MPPVSMTMNLRRPMRASPYCRSRVMPGKSDTNAARVRVSRLNKVDFPTLGRPTMATTGNINNFTKWYTLSNNRQWLPHIIHYFPLTERQSSQLHSLLLERQNGRLSGLASVDSLLYHQQRGNYP